MSHPTGIPADTSPEAYRVQTEALRRLGPKRRAAMTFELNEKMLARVAAGVRMRHPEYTDEQVRLATIRLRLGDAWFRLGFPGVEIKP
jgi:hypothetical protein